jgi:hypothetical protein
MNINILKYIVLNVKNRIREMKIKKYSGMLYYLLSSLLFVYCGGPNINRGSLSEAVQKSNDDYKEKREVTRTVVSDDTSNRCFFCGITVSDTPEPTYSDTSSISNLGEWGDDWEGDHYWGIRSFLTNKFSRNFKSSLGFGVLTSFRGERKAHELEIQGEVFTSKTNSKFYGSTNQLLNLGIGYHRLRFLTPFHTIMGLCIKDGFDINAAFWLYRNPVFSNVYNEDNQFLYSDTIEVDGIFSMNIDIGLEWLVIQHSRMGLSFGLFGGATFYWFDTFSSLRNDLLYPDGYLKLTAQLLIKKRKHIAHL